MVHHEACVSKKMCFVCIRYRVGTGYMDSLLEHYPQSTSSVRLGQQNLPGFFQQSVVPIKNLVTKSFGDDTRHSFLEIDIQRLAGVICVKREDKAKVSGLGFGGGGLGDTGGGPLAGHGWIGRLAEDFCRLPPGNSEEYILLFFKLYPKDKELCFVEGLFINALLKPSVILTKVHQMGGFMPYQQTEARGARIKFMCAGISYKYSHEPTLGLLYHFLQLCKYSCSSSPCFAPTDACILACKMFSRNLYAHPINLCSFRKDGHVHPPLMDIVANNFAELPQEILMDIFALLEVPDLVRAGSVCPSWNSAYTSMCNFGQYKWPQTPCLFYTSESAGENVAFLYSLAEKKAYNLTLPEPPIHRRYLIGSSHGWLITADERSEMHLINPITTEQIALPSVITLEQVTPIFDETGVICKYLYSRRTAKSVVGSPQTVELSMLRNHLFHKAHLFYDTSDETYIVVLIQNPFGQVSFARLGDMKWTWLQSHSNIEDVIYKNGILYAATIAGEVIAFNLSGPVVSTEIIVERRVLNFSERIYIVEAPWGDLLQIRRPQIRIKEVPDGCGYDATLGNRTWRIRMYKVCMASRKLVEIKSLDDHALFLGHSQSLCYRAEKYLQVKPNHVYFTDDCDTVCLKLHLRYRLNIGILNLKTHMMEEIVSPRSWSNCMAPLLITPNPRKMNSAFHS